jgi:hypothetical protein
MTIQSAKPSRRALLYLGIFACALAWLASTATAHAARNITTGVTDPNYFSADPAERAMRFDASVDVHAGVARIDVLWGHYVGTQRPANPTDPNDPGYDFTALDAPIRDASARGLDILLTVYHAPDWAEGPNRPEGDDDVPSGTWKPNPQDFADFGTALATRYSGSFVPASGGDPLPEVRHFEAWNEENLWAYLTPQYDGKEFVAGDHYRRLINAFYDAIHNVNDKARVLIGGNAPYGDPPGALRTRPLIFLRDLFCLTPKLEPTSCPDPVKFDILAVLPINLSGGPTQSAISPDDVTTPDVPNAVKVLRAAEKAKTIAGKRHRVWATEFWWQAYPGDPNPNGLTLRQQAKYVEQSLYLFWKAGTDVAINYEVCDTPFPDPEGNLLHTGLFLADCSPKLAATAFRFPFVLDRKSKSKVSVWGRSPAKGKLTIEKKSKGGWRKVANLSVKRDKVFTSRLTARGAGKYRATVGTETSLVWSLRQ